MLVLSMVASLPGLIGFACHRDDAAAKTALKSARAGDPALDAVLRSGASPELRGFAEAAKADADRFRLAGEFADEAGR